MDDYSTSPNIPFPSWLETKNSQKTIFFNQRIIFTLFFSTGRIWRRSLVNELAESDLVHGTRYVIACNHQSRIDPFLICTQVPNRIWRHMGTLNYFAANGLFGYPVLGWILVRFGAFPANAHLRHPFGLDYAYRMLKRGNTVLIFPEGRRTLRGETPPKKGVEILAHEANVMVIPAHIEWKRGWPWRTFKLGLGKPFDARGMTAQQIMNRVYQQPVE